MRMEVGVREFRENLAEWIDRAAGGDEVIVTERGLPRVRLSAATGDELLDRLVRDGRATAPTRPRRPLPPPLPVEGNPVTDALLRHRGTRET